MKKKILSGFMGVMMLAASLTSCKKSLDLAPTNDVTADKVYATAAGYKEGFAKVYGAFALTGNNGPAGSPDVQAVDEGTSDFLRLFWKAQELSTDEAVIAWGDVGIQDFHNMNWSASNPFLKGLYYRSLYQITLANEFIRQSADDKLASRGISGTDATNIRQYRAEARFLRAYQYWVLLDLFGHSPFVTENDLIGTTPKQADRKTLFAYVESELKAIDGTLAAPRTNEYGRADQAAEWALLSRLYLNATVYTGTDRYTDAITYANKVISSNKYSLIGNYQQLMLADNQQNTNEFIMTINYDGLHTQNYGGTTFLVHAAVGGSENAANFGIAGGWGGTRTTKALVNLFPDATGTADKRAEFYSNGQNLEIKDQSTFTDGYAVTKFRNVTRTGAVGQSLDYCDVDFPIFRLSEVYLTYAEAVLRGGSGGDLVSALGYVNQIRTRAYGNITGNIATLTLNFILDERARELYWEGFRRTDLIRFSKFTDASYLWPWKGGVAAGKAVETFRTLYPIPADDLNANPNLSQNTGY